MSFRVRPLRRVPLYSTGTRSGCTNPFNILRRSSSVSSPPKKASHILGTLGIVTSGILLTAYYLDSRSAIHRYLVPPLLRACTDAETVHLLAIKALALGVAPRDLLDDDRRLEAELWGIKLSSPLGLAAGFDKHAEAMDGLFALGFSWVEVGSVTPKAQAGNPQPRVFYLGEDNAIINRYGFPSVGFPLVVARLRSFLSGRTSQAGVSSSESASDTPHKILAVNLGKNKASPPGSISDYLQGVRTFRPLADVLVINVSSPNTPGLRGLQSRDFLFDLLTAVVRERDVPPPSPADAEHPVVVFATKWSRPKIVVKIAPDLNEEELIDIAEAVERSGVDGVIVSNTTIQRPKTLGSSHASETGGLSGPPLFPFALSALRTLRTLLPAEIPIIGCGGISTGSDALAFAKAGASSVQFYTALSTDGAGAVRRIKDELVRELESDPSEGKTWAEVSQSAVRALAGTHPERYQARQAKATSQPSEAKLAVEAGELKREAEALKELLAQAGVQASEALAAAVENRDIDGTLKAMGLGATSEVQSLEEGGQDPTHLQS